MTPAPAPPATPSEASILTPPPDTLAAYTDAIEASPGKIGYLHELGLDYGWGPSSMIQWVLEHIHVYTGLPWWASIMTAAIGIRLALLRPAMRASDMSIRIREVKPLADPINEAMRAHAKAGDQVAAMAKRAELKQLYQRYGVKTSAMFWPLLQIPLGFGGFRVTRGMAELPVPALEHEHFLWIPDLTLRDPYLALGVVSGVMVYFSIKRGGETGTAMNPQFAQILKICMPLLSAGFLMIQPGAVAVYFVTQTTTGILQAYLMTIRQYFNLRPLHPTSGPGAAGLPIIQTYSTLREREEAQNSSFIDKTVNNFKKTTSDMRKTVSDQYKSARNQQTEKKDRLGKEVRKMAEQVEAERRLEANWGKQQRNQKARERARSKALGLEDTE